jgi:hypothetical protein
VNPDGSVAVDEYNQLFDGNPGHRPAVRADAYLHNPGNGGGGSTGGGGGTTPNPPTVGATSGSDSPFNGDHINNVVVSWGAVAGATQYVVYRNGKTITTVPSSSTTYDDNSLPAGGALSYQVSSVDSSGHASGLSSAVTVEAHLHGQGGAVWTQDGTGGDYCRRTGLGGSFSTQHLECTTFDGTNWGATSDSGGNIDWGYDT